MSKLTELTERYDAIYKEVQDTQEELTDNLQPRFRVTSIDFLEELYEDAKAAQAKADDLEDTRYALEEEVEEYFDYLEDNNEDSNEADELLTNVCDLKDEIDNIREGNE